MRTHHRRQGPLQIVQLIGDSLQAETVTVHAVITGSNHVRTRLPVFTLLASNKSSLRTMSSLSALLFCNTEHK
jgi:hypothetical protein